MPHHRVVFTTDGDVEHEAVLKELTGIELGVEGPANEKLGSLVAADLGLRTPRSKITLRSPGAQGVRTGEIKWFGGFNSKTGVENAYGFISASNEDVYFHRSQTLASSECLVAGAPVVFLPATDKRGKVAATSVRVLSEMPEAELVALLKDTNLAAEVAVAIASVGGVITPCENEVLHAVSVLSRVVPNPRILERFWETFSPSRPQDPFFELAPPSVKSKVCKRHYSSYLSRLRNLFKSVNTVRSSVTADAVYGALTEEDRKLAASWAHGQNEGVLAQMLSARAAERAARTIYESIGAIVVDISITQLEGVARDWTTHDLLLNSSIPVDVKNARRPFNSKMFYVEHTVPRFKLDRHGSHVRVAAILSPYLQLKYIDDPKSAKISWKDDLIYLGETSRNDLDRLTSKFSSENFEVARSYQRTFPHWAFGYPELWYRELLADISETTNNYEWPVGDEWTLVLDCDERLSSVPALCVMGKPLPTEISTQLLDWQVNFYSKLQSGVGQPPSLPAVFLVVLKDFLAALRETRDDFTPKGYMSVLYSGDQCIHPLGAIDPLKIVYSLVTTLTMLWNHRGRSNLERFSSFRFGGLGILQGRGIGDREWTTILAYCGGTVYETDESGRVILEEDGRPQSPKGKCGHTPVVIGINTACSSCRKLICEKCGFCSVPCRDLSFRALAEQEKKKSSHFKSRPRPSQLDVAHEMPKWESVPLEAYEDGFRRG